MQYKSNKKLPTIVLIHALNPYGFKTNRRVNEDNIDLNRNFLSEEEFNYVKSRDPNFSRYVELNKILNPTSKPFSSIFLNELYSMFIALQAVMTYGVSTIKTGRIYVYIVFCWFIKFNI